MRRRVSPVTRLRRRVNAYELAAADDIVSAHAMSSGATGGGFMEPSSGIRPDAADAVAARRADALRRFSRWRADLNGTPALVAAEAVLMREEPLRAVDRENHWRNGTAMGHLVAALRHYAALAGNTPRGERWRYSKHIG